jgi:hypothetical protein
VVGAGDISIQRRPRQKAPVFCRVKFSSFSPKTFCSTRPGGVAKMNTPTFLHANVGVFFFRRQMRIALLSRNYQPGFGGLKFISLAAVPE